MLDFGLQALPLRPKHRAWMSSLGFAPALHADVGGLGWNGAISILPFIFLTLGCKHSWPTCVTTRNMAVVADSLASLHLLCGQVRHRGGTLTCQKQETGKSISWWTRSQWILLHLLELKKSMWDVFHHPLVMETGLLGMSSQLYKSSGTEEFLFFLCSGNGIWKIVCGFLPVAIAIFPNTEFLGLSTEKLSCKCGDEQREGGSLLCGCFLCSLLAGV